MDTTGYNVPDPSTSMLTVEVNSTAAHAFIGTKEGFYMLNTLSNDTHWYNDDYDMPYNISRVLKYYPTKGYLLIGTFQDVTGICGGLTVFDTNIYVFMGTYNWTIDPYYPRAIYDIEIDLDRDIGYIVSGPGSVASSTESGLLVFNASTFEGIMKSAAGALFITSHPFTFGTPYYIEGMIASVELDENNGDLICGSIQLLQRVDFVDNITVNTDNSPILGLLHNLATDVSYDPIDDKMYVSTLLGLDRVDPLTLDIEHLITGVGGAGGDTAGKLLVSARMMYYHTYYYDIVGGTSGSMNSNIPLNEYGHVMDIASSYNETLLYYSVSSESGGLSSNGSMIIYNRLSDTFVVENFGYNKSELEVRMIVQDPTDDVLYVGTDQSLILYNLTTLTEISRFGAGIWDVRSLEWIEGDLWVGLGEGPYIYIFHPETGLYETFIGADQILYPSINDIYYHATNNEVYICANSGLYVFNMTNSMLKYESEAEDLSTLFTSAAAYCEITDEIYIGSFQGVNIYDPLFDDKLPEIEIGQFVHVSGNFAFEASGKDYSGVKNVTVEIFNATAKKIWTILSDFLSISFDTTQYDDGVYTLAVYVTDWNGLMNTTSQAIEIDNVVIGEYSALTALIIFPVVACIVYFSRRKR